MMDSGAIIDDINLIEQDDTVIIQKDRYKSSKPVYNNYSVPKPVMHPAYIPPYYAYNQMRPDMYHYKMFSAPMPQYMPQHMARAPSYPMYSKHKEESFNYKPKINDSPESNQVHQPVDTKVENNESPPRTQSSDSKHLSCQNPEELYNQQSDFKTVGSFEDYTKTCSTNNFK